MSDLLVRTAIEEGEAAVADVLTECDRQVALGFTADHDDRHSTSEWIVLMSRYLGKVGDAAETYETLAYRHRLVELTAMGLQALRSLDRVVTE